MKRMRETRNGLLCAVLAAQLIFSPVLGATVRAAGVTPDPNAAADKRPSVDAAPNGVPLVNITAANGSGLSHNQYHDFNVRQQGLILNNSAAAANSQLGGIVAGNPNFHGNHGAEARTILNEVTSANRSRIEGYIEVNGRAADVILANPNGVTVNGGGFINVPRATITTGRPQVDADGALRGYEVRQGDIRIEGAGINADNMDAFTLLARTAHVEAQVRADNLAVVTGRNHVAADGTVTPLADAAAVPQDKPEVGIDSSALGGMYANRITLIATEKGVGVNLAGAVQSADQMVITADGKLRLREAASGGDAVLASKGDVEITGGGVTAARDLTVSADNLRVSKGVPASRYGTREAEDEASGSGAAAAPAAQATEPEPRKSSLLYAGRDMLLTAASELSNTLSEIRAEGDLRISGAKGVRNDGGTVAAGKELAISAPRVSNDGGSLEAGENLTVIRAASLSNTDGRISAGQNLTLLADSLENTRGELRAALEFRHAGADGGLAESLRNVSGVLSAGKDMTLRARIMENLSGRFTADGDLALRGDSLNNDRGEISTPGALSFLTLDGGTATSLRNASGALSAGSDLTLLARALENLSGRLTAGKDLALRGDSLSNEGGEISAQGALSFLTLDGGTATSLRNASGALSAGSDLTLLARTLENLSGRLTAGKNLALRGESLNNDQGEISAQGALSFLTLDGGTATSLRNASGALSAGGDLTLLARALENLSGRLTAGKDLALRGESLNNDQGEISAQGALSFLTLDGGAATSLRNASGALSAGSDLTLWARALENLSGRLAAGRDLALRGESLNNDQGEISAQGGLSLSGAAGGTAASVRNASGSLTAGGMLRLDARVLDNVSGLLGAGGDMALLRLDSLNNTGGGLIMAREMLVNADALLNEQSEIRASGTLELAGAQGAQAVSLRNSSGTISADRDLSLNVGRLVNERTVLNIARDTSSQFVRYWEDNQRWGDGDEAWWDSHSLTRAWDSLVKATPAAAILASGDIRIAAGTVYNAYSHIAAGKDLHILAVDSLTNQSAAVYVSDYEHVVYNHLDDDDDRDEYDSPRDFTTREVLTPFAASLTAGQTVTLTGAALQNLTDRDYASPLTGKDLGDLTHAGAPDVPGVISPHLPALSPLAPDGPTAPSLSQVVEVLAQSSMFRPVTSPGHHYLIETNPMLTKLGNFYGSDYFWERIGLDRDRQEAVALGDAFFETRLVQQQVLDATGRRFLSGYSSDADQMRGLMDNAVAQAGDLKLAAGVALSSQQVAALTDDIVWLVEQEVNGQKVMVPQVYLAANSKKAVFTGGSLIAANEVNIAAGSVTNSGSTIRGGNLSVVAGGIANTGGGVLTGGTVQLAAVEDIRNTGSTISGDSLNLAAGRDIVSEARIMGGNGVTRLGQTGGIAAADGLHVGAGRDVTLAGSNLAAGGDARISAGRDVSVTTVTTGSSFHGYHLDEDKVTNHGSSVTAGGNLQMVAGNDLTVAGSGVGVVGDATLAAGRNLTVTAVQDVFKQEIRGSSSNGLLGSSSSRRNEERVTSKAATVAAGGNLNLLAGVTGLTPGASGDAAGQKGHASVVGSTLIGGKDLTVAASGNVNVASAQDSYYYSYSKSSTGALGLSSSSKKEGNASVTQVASTLMGQNITLDAGKSVGVTASSLAAVNNINLTARDGDVAVVDGTNQSTSWYSKTQTGFGLGGSGSFTSFYGTEGKKEQSAGSTSKGSSLAAGQDINLTASRDAAVVGSKLSAGNNVTINAGRDANILSGVETSSHSKETFASGFGVEGILGLDKTSFFMGYQDTAKGNADAKTRNVGSQITADKNITINAGQNVNMSGSRLAAAQDLNMTAGKDINLLQATDTASASSYEKTLRAGLSLNLEQNLTTNAQQIYQNAKSATQADGLLGAAQSGFKAVNSVGQTLTNSSASAGLTLGVNASQSSSESHATKAVPTELAAGQNMNLTAGQDLTMQGTQAQAGKDMTLAAGRDLNIHAAVSTADSDSQNSSWGASVGLKATVSKNGPTFGLSANGELGMGWSDSEGTSYHNAKVTAGEKLTTISGQDTTVAGGNLTAKDVDMTVGRNLTVASKQDTGEGSSGQFKVSAGASAGYGADLELPSFSNAADAAKATTLKAGLTVGNGSAEKRWVTEQSSILGTDSVNIRTENNTHVAGAIIAALNDNLKLDTGTLSYENLHGVDNSSKTSWGVNWQKQFNWNEQGNQPQTTEKNDKSTVTTKPDNGKDDGKVKIPHFAWVDGIVKGQENLQKGWKDVKGTVMFSPGAYTHQSTEKSQTAYATIGKGEIIVRDNPGQSLEGLNRDQNKTTSESQSVTNINYKAAFTYVDEVIAMQGIPYALKDANEMWENPKGFWDNQWADVQNAFAGLKNSFSQIWGTLSGKKEQPQPPQAAPPVYNTPQQQGKEG